MHRNEKPIGNAIIRAMNQKNKPLYLLWQSGTEGIIRRLRERGINAFEAPV